MVVLRLLAGVEIVLRYLRVDLRLQLLVFLVTDVALVRNGLFGLVNAGVQAVVAVFTLCHFAGQRIVLPFLVGFERSFIGFGVDHRILLLVVAGGLAIAAAVTISAVSVTISRVLVAISAQPLVKVVHIRPGLTRFDGFPRHIELRTGQAETRQLRICLAKTASVVVLHHGGVGNAPVFRVVGRVRGHGCQSQCYGDHCLLHENSLSIIF